MSHVHALSLTTIPVRASCSQLLGEPPPSLLVDSAFAPTSIASANGRDESVAASKHAASSQLQDGARAGAASLQVRLAHRESKRRLQVSCSCGGRGLCTEVACARGQSARHARPSPCLVSVSTM
eukprot:1454353-Pleurochrysis_carterae.AAC.1